MSDKEHRKFVASVLKNMSDNAIKALKRSIEGKSPEQIAEMEVC